MNNKENIRVKILNEGYVYAPKATKDTLGVVKPGKYLEIDDTATLSLNEEAVEQIDNTKKALSDFNKASDEALDALDQSLTNALSDFNKASDEALDALDQVKIDFEEAAEERIEDAVENITTNIQTQTDKNKKHIDIIYNILNDEHIIYKAEDLVNDKQRFWTGEYMTDTGDYLEEAPVDNSIVTIKRIEGVTKTTQNVLPYPSNIPNAEEQSNETWTLTTHGVTFTMLKDGSILVNGTNDSDEYDSRLTLNFENGLLKKGCKYTLSGDPAEGTSTTAFIDGWMKTPDRKYQVNFCTRLNHPRTNYIPVDGMEVQFQIVVKRRQTVRNLIFYPTLTLGTEPVPYEKCVPFASTITDIEHSKLTGITSTGRNALNIEGLVGNSLKNNEDGTFTLSKFSGGRFSGATKIRLPKTLWLGSADVVKIYNETTGEIFEEGDYGISYRMLKNLTIGAGGIPSVVGFSSDSTKGAFGIPEKTEMYISGSAQNGYSIKFKNFMIRRASEKEHLDTPESYRKYFEETMEISKDEPVELQGFDYIEDNKIVRQTEVLDFFENDDFSLNFTEEWVDLGAIEWTQQSTHMFIGKHSSFIDCESLYSVWQDDLGIPISYIIDNHDGTISIEISTVELPEGLTLEEFKDAIRFSSTMIVVEKYLYIINPDKYIMISQSVDDPTIWEITKYDGKYQNYLDLKGLNCDIININGDVTIFLKYKALDENELIQMLAQRKDLKILGKLKTPEISSINANNELQTEKDGTLYIEGTKVGISPKIVYDCICKKTEE